MSLARAERRRLFKRRFTRYMLLIVLLVLGTVAIATFFTNEKVGPSQVAAAQQEADRQYQENLRAYQDFVRSCQPNCGEAPAPRREDYQAQWYMPATFEFRTDFEETVSVLAGVLALFAFVVGASYVGAEWHSGGMMNLLLWRPRRLGVLLAKFGTLLGALLGITVGLAAAWTAAFWGIASLRGSTAGMTSGAWQSLGLTGLRGLGLVLVAGAIGFGLASVGRHTALALGAAVGVGVVGFVGVAIALSLIEVKFIERWLWPRYLQAWMEKKVTLQDFDACDFSARGGCQPATLDITWQQSGVLFAVVTAAILLAALWTMRRRDIT